MTDSPLAYRYVPAPDRWPRGGAVIRGIAIHMAEGGGTVSWLTRNDGNSSHYVVEYKGGIVQMVPEAEAAGSINPHALRTSDDAPYVYLGETIRYGHSAGVKALGTEFLNPNAAVIAIEIEGFAAVGPNAAQRTALRALVADIRRRRGALAVLGHRDFQSYKACPGHRLPWADYGGHGSTHAASAPPITPEVKPVAIKGSLTPEVPTRVHLDVHAWLYVWSDHRADAGNKQLDPDRPLLLTRFIDADTYAVAYEPTTADTNATSVEYFVKVADIAHTEVINMDTRPAVRAFADKAIAALTALRP